jgi:hypothetical protein
MIVEHIGAVSVLFISVIFVLHVFYDHIKDQKFGISCLEELSIRVPKGSEIYVTNHRTVLMFS